MKRGLFLFLWSIVFIGFSVGCASEKTVAAEPKPPVIQSPDPVGSRTAAAEPVMPSRPTASTDSAISRESESGSSAVAGPVITFEESVHDFGDVGPSSSQTVDFQFRNTGDSVLKIERFHAPCGCTVPELAKRDYAPGESGVIKVRYNAPAGAATDIKPVYVYTNDPVNPQYELTIKAKVSVNVAVSPAEVPLLLNQDNAGMPKLTVKSTDGRAFSITSATSTNNVINISFDRNETAAEIVLEPKVDLQKLDNTPTGVIQIRTSHPQSGTLSVRFNTKPMFDVSHPRIILQNIAPGEEILRDIWIRSNYDEKVEIASYSSKEGMLSIDSQRYDGNHLQIMLKFKAPTDGTARSRRYIADELNIQLASGQELTIRCNAWFRPN